VDAKLPQASVGLPAEVSAPEHIGRAEELSEAVETKSRAVPELYVDDSKEQNTCFAAKDMETTMKVTEYFSTGESIQEEAASVAGEEFKTSETKVSAEAEDKLCKVHAFDAAGGPSEHLDQVTSGEGEPVARTLPAVEALTVAESLEDLDVELEHSLSTQFSQKEASISDEESEPSLVDAEIQNKSSQVPAVEPAAELSEHIFEALEAKDMETDVVPAVYDDEFKEDDAAPSVTEVEQSGHSTEASILVKLSTAESAPEESYSEYSHHSDEISETTKNQRGAVPEINKDEINDEEAFMSSETPGEKSEESSFFESSEGDESDGEVGSIPGDADWERDPGNTGFPLGTLIQASCQRANVKSNPASRLEKEKEMPKEIPGSSSHSLPGLFGGPLRRSEKSKPVHSSDAIRENIGNKDISGGSSHSLGSFIAGPFRRVQRKAPPRSPETEKREKRKEEWAKKIQDIEKSNSQDSEGCSQELFIKEAMELSTSKHGLPPSTKKLGLAQDDVTIDNKSDEEKSEHGGAL